MHAFDDELPSTLDYSHALLRFLQHGNAIGEAILETMPHPIIVFNENLKIVRANLQAKKYFHRQAEQINGFLLSELCSDFEPITTELLKKHNASLDLKVGAWVTKSLLHMDNKSYYMLYK